MLFSSHLYTQHRARTYGPKIESLMHHRPSQPGPPRKRSLSRYPLMLDFSPVDLRGNEILLFEATRFVVIGYNSLRKPKYD